MCFKKKNNNNHNRKINRKTTEVVNNNRSISSLSSIQKMSLISVKNNKKIITALGELKGLRKLGLADFKKEDGRNMCCSLQEMKKLSTLDIYD